MGRSRHRYDYQCAVWRYFHFFDERTHSSAIELLIQLGAVVALSDICPRLHYRPHRSIYDSISSFFRPILK
jgi:hypothetical protein